MKCLVIDGTLPVAEITKQLMRAMMNGVGVGVDFDGVEDAEVKQAEINAMIREINEMGGRRTFNPVHPKGNRKARRAAAAQRRGKR